MRPGARLVTALFVLAVPARTWAAAAPGDEGRKRLEAFVGSWTIRVQSWAGADAAPEESDGDAEIRWVLGGRFIEQRQRSRSASGLGYVGFDETKRRYESLWLDDQESSVLHTSGEYLPSSRTILTRGTVCDPRTGRPAPFEEELALDGRDRFAYEAWVTGPGGARRRVMRIVYVRKPRRK